MTLLDEYHEVVIDGNRKRLFTVDSSAIKTDIIDLASTKKRKQIPKAIYKQVNYNDKDELIKLIHQQSIRLDIEIWEIEGLIKACDLRDCLDKGFNVVYEYAGRFDRVSILFERHSKLMLELTQKIESRLDIRSPDVINAFSSLSDTTAKIWHAICSVRKLQSSPKPIFVSSNNSNTNLIDSFTASQILLISAQKIINLFRVNNYELSLFPIEELIFILSPVFVFSQLDKMELNISIDNKNLFESLRNVYETEIRIFNLYVKLNGIPITKEIYGMDDNDIDYIDHNIEHCLITCLNIEKSNIYNEYPTFRLPYFETPPPIHPELRWFNDGLIYYKGICKLIEGEISKRNTSSDNNENNLPNSPLKIQHIMASSMNVKELVEKIKPATSTSPIINKNNHSTKKNTTNSPKLGGTSPTPVHRKSLVTKNTVKTSASTTTMKLEHPENFIPDFIPDFLNKESTSDNNLNRQRRASSEDIKNITMINKNRSYSAEAISDGIKKSNKKNSKYLKKPITPKSDNQTSILNENNQLTNISQNHVDENDEIDEIVNVNPRGGSSPPRGGLSPSRGGLSPARGRVTSFEHNDDFTSNRGRSTSPSRKNKNQGNTSDLAMLLIKKYDQIEILSEAQIIHRALGKINIHGVSIYQLAARKIKLWWRLVYPRKRYLMRMLTRNIVKSLIFECSDTAVVEGILSIRRRRRWIRTHAAIKIQRMARIYTSSSLSECKRKALQKRRVNAENLWLVLYMNIVNAFKVAHYMRRINRFLSKKFHNHYRRPVPRSKVLKNYFEFIFSKTGKPQSAKEESVALSKEAATALVVVNKGTESYAILVIQKVARRFLSKLKRNQKVLIKFMKGRLLTFMAHSNIRRKVALMRLKKRSAIKIQSLVRSFLARVFVFHRTEAGIKLYNIMRKHRAHNNLRKNLRRVERPHKISVSILRNIPPHVAQCGSLKFRISIWWNPLLHIISEADYGTVINNAKKPPQMIYLSKVKNVVQSKIHASYTQDAKSKGLPLSISGAKRSGFHNLEPIDSVKEEEDDDHDSVNDNNNNSKHKHRVRSKSAIIGSGSAARTLQQKAVNLSKYNQTNDEDLDSVISSINDIESLTNTLSFIEEQDDISDDDNRIVENDILFPIRKSFVRKKIETLREIASENQDNAVFEDTSHFTVAPKKSNKLVSGGLAFLDFSKNIVSSLGRITLGLDNSKRFRSYSINSNYINNCVFDEVIKIPGCHGNSVFKFEILHGERNIKLGENVFYMNKYGNLMFWGGSYCDNITLNILDGNNITKQSKNMKKNQKNNDICNTTLEYRVESGPPLRSKCSWVRLKFKGNGPAKNSIRSKGFFSSFLEKWIKFYISVDSEALDIYEKKYETSPFISIPITDFKTIRLEFGNSTRFGTSGKFVAEDTWNVILTTKRDDEIYMRFADGGLRVNWFDVFEKLIDENLRKSSMNKKNKMLENVTKLAKRFSIVTPKGVKDSSGIPFKLAGINSKSGVVSPTKVTPINSASAQVATSPIGTDNPSLGSPSKGLGVPALVPVSKIKSSSGSMKFA